MSVTPEILTVIAERLQPHRGPVPFYECRHYPHTAPECLEKIRLADSIVSSTPEEVTFLKNGMTYCVTYPPPAPACQTSE